MLTTRLWMGAILIALTVGVLLGDQHLEPWFPFLLLFQLGLGILACYEMIALLGERAPQPPIAYAGVVTLILSNWVLGYLGQAASFWLYLSGILAGFVLLAFLYEMTIFTGPGRSTERIALTLLIIAYLGLLPCFFAQIRWISDIQQDNSIRLALAVFVPKCCDIGAYFTGRLLGRHKMTPVLSPKKTWEGAIGGLATAALAAILFDRLAPSSTPILRQDFAWEVAFGLSVGLAGMLGDLAESLIKRDCQTKDASAVMPGFGGVLDVVDAIIYAAPVCYFWFYFLKAT